MQIKQCTSATSDNNEYSPVNYYGRFLKSQIEDLQSQKTQSLKHGKKIKLNSRFLRELYYQVWQQKLSEGVRRHYRDNWLLYF